MFRFFKAYRRLNIFLFVFGICPFLQCKKTQRFISKLKYLIYIYLTTLSYFILVGYLSFTRTPPLTASLTSMVRILKFCRSIGNTYALFFVINFLLFYRKSHANFFNQLYQFDRTYNKQVKPSIKYTIINRIYWIEILTFSSYMIIIFFTEVEFNENMRNWRNILFWGFEVAEQIVYAFVVFHMKNCANNLTTRFQQMIGLLNKIATEDTKSFKIDTHCWQLENVAQMLDILFKARNNLQCAFGSVLLVIFIYNLFGVALSSYIMIDANIYESNQRTRKHLYYITIKYFAFELPLILKDFYFTVYFHFLGNTVCNLHLKYHLFFQIFERILKSMRQKNYEINELNGNELNEEVYSRRMLFKLCFITKSNINFLFTFSNQFKI